MDRTLKCFCPKLNFQSESFKKGFSNNNMVDEDDFDNSIEASSSRKMESIGHMNGSSAKQCQSPKAEAYSSLKQEILQLERRLELQFEVRQALEKALGYRFSSHGNTSEMSTPKPAPQLIKEIAVLELEVVYLEQYLLSLYRKAFDQQQITYAPPSTNDKILKSPLSTPRVLDITRHSITSKRDDAAIQSGCQSLDDLWKDSDAIRGKEKLLDYNVKRCRSSVSQDSPVMTKRSPTTESSMSRALRACHSQPLSRMEYDPNASSSVISLAEHFGVRISDHVPKTANRLSEDLIKSMSAIYCRLADPSLRQNSLLSPISSQSSMSAFSPQDQCDMWSPGLRNNSSFDVRLDNPFNIEGFKEFSGPYSTMVEVQQFHQQSQKLGDVEHLLKHFRSLTSRLEEVDPRKLNHEEKLAFWINVHNALVMHANLAYGVPQNKVKRFFLLLKAAYNVGGQTVSADTIQSSILGCRMPRPVQWLWLLLPSKTKFKRGDNRQACGIEHTEPLLHFALCSGSHSDPAVRVYTPMGIHHELQSAKEEFIKATFGIRNDQKILLPKTIQTYAKDSGLCQAGIMVTIQQSLPESLQKRINKRQLGQVRNSIEWIPHNFTFRYLLSKDLVKY